MINENDEADIEPGLYIGLMSGTSIDGIDSLVARISPQHFEIINQHSSAFPTNIRNRLSKLCQSPNASICELGELSTECGRLMGAAVTSLLTKSNLTPNEICAIGSHGQTIRHAPIGPKPFSLQLGDASVIADESGIKTIADFRMADIACGGQGAPLVPAFHNAVFRSTDSNRAIINIGGISNITVLPKDTTKNVTGYDIGPGNTLMDQWINQKTGSLYDNNGNWGRSGQIVTSLLKNALSEDYFKEPAPKSTGRELFNLEWLAQHIDATSTLNADQDIQATLTELSAITISKAVNDCASALQGPLELYLCGGGVKNSFLLERIQHHTPGITVCTTQKLGMDPQLVEAAAFAWLAYRTYNGLPGNLPCVTGAKKKKVLGGIYHP